MAEWEEWPNGILITTTYILRRVPPFLSTKMGRPRSEKAAAAERKIQEALASLEAGEYENPHQAALALGISTSTLARRANGGLSRQEANEPNQFLTAGE